jgi:hypothetical protein
MKDIPIGVVMLLPNNSKEQGKQLVFLKIQMYCIKTLITLDGENIIIPFLYSPYDQFRFRYEGGCFISFATRHQTCDKIS